MENGREFRTVVYWKFVYLVRLFGLRVSLRIGPADEPEDRGHVPFGSEGPEIFACRSRPRFPDALRSEMPAKSLCHPLGGILVVHVERVLIDRGDFRRPRRPRCRRLSVCNPLYRGQHALAHAGVEGPDI